MSDEFLVHLPFLVIVAIALCDLCDIGVKEERLIQGNSFADGFLNLDDCEGVVEIFG